MNIHSTRQTVIVVGLIVATVMAGATVGCSSQQTPVGPINPLIPPPTRDVSTPKPPPPPPDGPTQAAVVIESAYAIVSQPPRESSGYYGYGVRFLLRETSGRSGATVERILIYGPSGSDEAGPGCWGDQLRVPPGGVLDTFYTDAGALWVLYCGPGSGGFTPKPSLMIRVTLKDDAGATSTVDQWITALR